MPKDFFVIQSGVGINGADGYDYWGLHQAGTYAKTIIGFESVIGASGMVYTIRGYRVADPAKVGLRSLVSGTLNSGDVKEYAFDSAYEKLEPGVGTTQSGRSGAVTIWISRKRRN